MPAPPEGSDPAMARTRGTRRVADGTWTGAASPLMSAPKDIVAIESGAAVRGRADVADKEDIPSPVLTGQVQRVCTSAGSVLGTPCQSPSLAGPSVRALHVGLRLSGLNTGPVKPNGPALLLQRRPVLYRKPPEERQPGTESPSECPSTARKRVRLRP